MKDEILIKTINGFCNYCKDELLLSEDYVVSGENKYHITCYHLKRERDGEIIENE